MSELKAGFIVTAEEVRKGIKGLSELLTRYDSCNNPCISSDDFELIFREKTKTIYAQAIRAIAEFIQYDIKLWNTFRKSDLISDEKRFNAGERWAEASNLSRKIFDASRGKKTYESLLLLPDVLSVLSNVEYEGQLYKDLTQRTNAIKSINKYLKSLIHS